MMARGSAGDALRELLETAANEARRRGDRRIGTDHLLMALLRRADSSVAAVLGVSRETVATAVESLDRDALEAVGIDIRNLEIPEVEVTARRFPPLSSGSREVIKQVVEIARPHKTGTIAPVHLIAALMQREKPDPVVEILEFLGVDIGVVRERVAGMAAKDEP